ncbi:MAG: isoleucine--tRNA ligase [Propionibacteriaceae bacterium]|nr:isoleucine--tRNA ligase [Propionibacteriaceae bacterium]
MTASPKPMYNAVPAMLDLSESEHEILAFWAAHDTFNKSLNQSAGGAPWTFYEGPPTANGMPGTHHIEARVFKDIFPRFKTMQGFHVDRRAGWDCHGLPVELAVEKELGFNGKPDIEAYGVERFNQKCRESVSRYVNEFEQLTTRMGYWVDFEKAYWTMNPSFVESVWWALKQIHSKGLLVEDYRVAPYCSRCGTTLSDHELAQGYEDVTDPSVYVRFPLISGPLAGKAQLLVWTTTPWTLVSNTAAAVHPDVTYVVASKDTETLVLAEPLAETVLGEGWRLGQTFSGREMEMWRYQRPFELVDFPDVVGGTHYVVLAEYVTTADGTGIVHQSPAFGADDMEVCRGYGLPMVNPILPNGTFKPELELVGGEFFKAADKALVADLEQRGLLYKMLPYEHSYPHCWRCHTVLMYCAQPSWYIRTTAIKDALLRENAATTWYPENIKWGRYGDWLNNNIDWALSRSRYWGTPLPIWRCSDDHQYCVGSRAELAELAGHELTDLDPHRPYVDEITFACPKCGKESKRVPEVIDAWFDSGSMPFAQLGYPHVPDSAAEFESSYPADFICEAIDQTRGWFYSLMAVGTAVFGKSSYLNVLCLGHILAEDGRKMSKHLNNILEPIPLLERHGADAVRWFMAAAGSPWASRRVGHGTIAETVRKVLMTLVNTVAFGSLYARANDWSPADAPAPVVSERQVLDRWLVATQNRLIVQVSAALEDFDTQRVGSLLGTFIDDLSNWYVRRSRRRFWDGDPAALWTLHETLEVLARLLAPLTPFISERIWQDLIVPVTPGAPESVHLAPWPLPREEFLDADLEKAMDLTRRVVELGRAARSEAKVKTRQPLRRALISSAALATLNEELLAEVMAELNVEGVESFASAGDLVSYSAKGNFRALGVRFAKQTPVVANAIAASDAAALAARFAEHDCAVIVVPEIGEVELFRDDVIISERPNEGWSVINEQGETVALDLEITPELELAGIARELIRLIQEARKTSGFDVSDRINVTWNTADPKTKQAVAAHQELIASEVLAVDFVEAGTTGEFREESLGFAFNLTKHG